ncbi:OLC1v1002980C1 [Oldenlandia corymbosa var. corymbosa]|uniref:OLC1v1002980C1 n=1 Tax=Oldenlandia corymbosa var. corymbosa TaxID=529605 RepID=A0AAV1D914_OLDCO|nr:OLC1v1002980C1 [Oldenlandia corymbosa var. corymbosa]
MDDVGSRWATSKQPSSKRRAMAGAIPEGFPPERLLNSKKRVVLGELTNIGDLRSPDNKPRITTDTIVQKESVDSEIDLGGGGDTSSIHSPLLYHHLRSREAEEGRRPLPDYMMKFQKEIKPAMRAILVDWLVEVADEFKLVADTLYLAVNYIDRYLSSHALSETKLQLLGISSMLVASKVEEISPLRAEDCSYITDNTYTKEEVIAMESNLLKFLNCNTYTPISKSFLRIFAEPAKENSQFENLQFEFLAHYILELSLTDYACVKFLPSVVAASAVFLAKFTIVPTIHPWSLRLQRYTGYKASELRGCIRAIHDLLLKNRSSAKAVRDKYMQPKYKCVASLCPQSEIPKHYFEWESDEKLVKEAGGEVLPDGRHGLRIHGWEIESRKGSILKSLQRQEWEEKLKTCHLPEMIFGDSTLVLKHLKTGVRIHFNAFDALLGWKQEALPPVEVPAAAQWKFRSKPSEQIILDYDYTFTTPYSGSETHETNSELTSAPEENHSGFCWEDCEERLDLVSLSSKEPILFYDEVVLYEDELADNGTSLLTVKLRVMPSSWFLLLRFWLRVDGVLMRLRDTRVHCRFVENAEPVVIRETCWREVTFKTLASKGYPVDSASYSDPSVVSQRLPIIMQKTQKLRVPDDLTAITS